MITMNHVPRLPLGAIAVAVFVAGVAPLSAQLLGPLNVLEEAFYPASVAAADLDGDGRLDVLAAGMSDVCWWANRGHDQTWPQTCLATGFTSGLAAARAADLDGDGDLDVVASTAPPVGILWWENQPGGWAQRTLCAECDAAWHLTPTDMDEDGDVDLVLVGARASGSGDHWIGWLENLAGDGRTWHQHVVAPAVEWAHRARACDLNGDGRTDIIAVSQDLGMQWWENLTSGWVLHAVPGSSPSWDVVPVDLDGDGDYDLVAGRGLSVEWWQNLDGTGSQWSDPWPVLEASRRSLVFAVAAADLDRDHDADIVAPLPGSDVFGWVENVSLSWTPHAASEPLRRPSDIVVADLDGDGDGELLLAESFGSGRVAWVENRLYTLLFADDFESGDLGAWTTPAQRP